MSGSGQHGNGLRRSSNPNGVHCLSRKWSRAAQGLICLLCLTAAPISDEESPARAERLAAVQMLLAEITSDSEDDTQGLPEDVAAAIDRWTDEIDWG